MRLNSVAPDLTVRIAVEIVTELLRFIFIKIEFHEAPFSHMSSCEQEDRVLHQGLNFHSAVVHCQNLVLLDGAMETLEAIDS